MKQHLLLYPAAALFLSLAACQQQPIQKNITETPTEKIATGFVIKAPVVDTTSVKNATLLSSEMRTSLTQVDLSPLWLNDIETASSPVIEGMYGTDRYRISLVFTRVEQDKKQPEIFYVRGKTRFKKVITPFEGTIQIESLSDLDTYVDVDDADSAQAYTATAHFIFTEASDAPNAGIFEGTGFLDWYITKKGNIDQLRLYADSGTPTKSSGLLFRGKWKSNSSKLEREVVWCNNLMAMAEEIFKDFGIGERGEEINPKYAKLGWDTYWENDEWWAEPATTITAQAKP